MWAFEDWLKQKCSNQGKSSCQEEIANTDDDETLANWLSLLLWHGVLGYKSIT